MIATSTPVSRKYSAISRGGSTTKCERCRASSAGTTAWRVSQFTAAVQKVYNSGQHNPVVFSHKFAIEYWTLMNTKNAKNTLLTTHPLPNIGRVVITGNPMTGWTLVDWDGIRDFHS